MKSKFCLECSIMNEPMDYASSGVDIDEESKAISELIESLDSSTRKSGDFGAPVDLPGGFGGIIEFGNNRLVLATDGVGSKLQIANHLGQLGGVGIDCVAMNVNDLICVGAEPIAFVDYIAVPKTDSRVHGIIGKSLSEACRRANITLAGGETATIPGIVKELDLSGTALGWFPKGNEITGSNLREGDKLIGVPSSGLHSNGYSLVRAVVEKAGFEYTDEVPFNTNHEHRVIERFPDYTDQLTLGEILLNPTRIYVDSIVNLLIEIRKGNKICEHNDIKAIAHITGGGLSNLLRLHNSLGWEISNPLPVHPEFLWIQQQGNVEDREMYRTFNMGVGMILAVSDIVAEKICEWLGQRVPGTEIIGEVKNHGRLVTHRIDNVRFDNY